MTRDRATLIRTRLEQRFAPLELEVQDDSAAHAGHAGARDGRGHFSVRIVAPAFAGHGRLERHRMIYAALGEMMQQDIHALSISAQSPDELH
ncbi:MAG TPA: BolA family protein [Gammaproteobacteria bacterium]|nr:BolA family protein [Gammaproteobacteria bacterium]HEV2333710.1 BolA family protein [Gammaproteobacteria bacterium]